MCDLTNIKNWTEAETIDNMQKIPGQIEYILQNIKTQTDTICMEAIIINAHELANVKNKTEAICLEAVRQNGYALEYVEQQTEAICLEAVRQYGDALAVVKQQTDEICMEAVRQDGYALQYVQQQTEAICLEAVRQYGEVLRFVEQQNEAICLEAVKQTGMALEYVNEQTEAICLEAVEQNGMALKYVKNKTPEICLEALRQNVNAITFINLDKHDKVTKNTQSNNIFYEDYVNAEVKLIITHKNLSQYIIDDIRKQRHIETIYHKNQLYGEQQIKDDNIIPNGLIMCEANPKSYIIYKKNTQKMEEKGWIYNCQIDNIQVEKLYRYTLLDTVQRD